MKYIVAPIVKIAIFPICAVMFLVAYLVFIMNPNMHKFKFRTEV